MHSRRTTTDGRSEPDDIAAALPELSEKLRQMAESGKAHLTEWRGGLQHGISEKPFQAVLAAAAAGAVIGLIIGLRSR